MADGLDAEAVGAAALRELAEPRPDVRELGRALGPLELGRRIGQALRRVLEVLPVRAAVLERAVKPELVRGERYETLAAFGKKLPRSATNSSTCSRIHLKRA